MKKEGQPPECPDCGCQHAPPDGLPKTLKRIIVLTHRCARCGRRFRRTIPKGDAKLYGVPENDIETSGD